MLPASRTRIGAMLSDDDQVLDVGGWARPFARADWVIDLMPYASRGLYGDPDPDPERFGEGTWIQRDFCAREPWPFADGQFDFAVCSQTLEDVRDPVWVCAELVRVARAGYIEVPSRLEEQSWGIHGDWVGWSHHHWLIDVDPGRVQFVFKSHALHGDQRFQFRQEFGAALTPEERVQTFFWEGGFQFEEVIFVEAESLDEYLASFVAANQHLTDGRVPPPSAAARVRRATSAFRRRARRRPG
jgi:Methyltransferase domain